LLILWLLGCSLHLGGGLIHLLLVVGLVVLVINLLSGRRTAIWRKTLRAPAPCWSQPPCCPQRVFWITID